MKNIKTHYKKSKIVKKIAKIIRLIILGFIIYLLLSCSCQIPEKDLKSANFIYPHNSIKINYDDSVFEKIRNSVDFVDLKTDKIKQNLKPVKNLKLSDTQKEYDQPSMEREKTSALKIKIVTQPYRLKNYKSDARSQSITNKTRAIQLDQNTKSEHTELKNPISQKNINKSKELKTDKDSLEHFKLDLILKNKSKNIITQKTRAARIIQVSGFKNLNLAKKSKIKKHTKFKIAEINELEDNKNLECNNYKAQLRLLNLTFSTYINGLKKRDSNQDAIKIMVISQKILRNAQLDPLSKYIKKISELHNSVTALDISAEKKLKKFSRIYQNQIGITPQIKNIPELDSDHVNFCKKMVDISLGIFDGAENYKKIKKISFIEYT